MMKCSIRVLSTVILLGGVALAQDKPRGDPSDGKLFELPSACQASGASTAANAGMQQSQNPVGSGSPMTNAHRGYQEAMMKMQKPMMVGMMAKDPDLAWACAMIAHHAGAVEMSRVVLRAGDDAQIKKMAEKTINDQTKEIRELSEWVEKHGPR